MQNGIDVYNLGISPTPVVFREARKHGAGVVVTSSHNPIDSNGLKFILEGRRINENELELVKTNQKIKKDEFGKETKIESDYVSEATKIIAKFKYVFGRKIFSIDPSYTRNRYFHLLKVRKAFYKL